MTADDFATSLAVAADHCPRPSAATSACAPGHRHGTSHTRQLTNHRVVRARRPRGGRIRVAFMLLMMFCIRRSYLLLDGVGIWGINIPVAWGFAIVNFVWWIGIGHAGTLISAILLLLHQTMADVDQPLRRGDDAVRRRLRGTVSRCCIWAGRGSSIGCCRIRTRWACGRSSAARWSGTCSPSAPTSPSRCCSGTSGLIPDLATMRDRAQESLATSHLRHSRAGLARFGAALAAAIKSAYLLLAGLATPLVVSVHSVVSSISPSALCPAGTRRSSRPTSWPARFSPASRWC